MTKVNVRDLDLAGKNVFVRVDYNVPLEDGKVTNSKRIRATRQTIDLLRKAGARIVLASHLGRPKGEVNSDLSLEPVAVEAASILGCDVEFVSECVGDRVKEAVGNMKDGDVLLLENLRFHKGEEANDPEFAKQLAEPFDAYVNDAFGAAHRAHASTAGIPVIVTPAAAGLLMEAELKYLGGVLENPQRPLLAVIGGAKVSDKIEVIENLLEKVDALIIGGGMAFTFIKAMGHEVGESLLEEDKVDLANELMVKAKEKGVALLLPSDVVVAPNLDRTELAKTVKINEIPADQAGYDIGVMSVAQFTAEITNARTIIWNGPMGVFEIERFAHGTLAVATAIGETSAVSIVGGGDSVAAVMKLNLDSQMTHISTGGGASMEFLEGKILPGVAALNDA